MVTPMATPRPNPTVRDMIVAIAVLLVPVLLISWWFTRVPEPPVTVVDWRPLLADAQAASPYPVAHPEALPETWTCVRARWTPKGEAGVGGRPVPGNTWQLGFLTPERVYLGIDQRDDKPADLISSASRQGSPDGTSTVAGRTWARYVSADGRTRALVAEASGATVVLSGDVPYGQLEAFAATLVFG